MDPLRIYDYLTLARQRVLDAAGTLSPQQYGSEFPIGLGTLARTLTHIMICEWFYVQRINRCEVPPYEQWPIRDEAPPPFVALEAEWKNQAVETRLALSAVTDWSEKIEYQSLGDGHPMLITASAADIFAQLAFHEIHHRAQAMNMLRLLGFACGDIDFNALMYTRRPSPGG